MAKLTLKSKSSNPATVNVMTVKENYHYLEKEKYKLQTSKYKKIVIASVILNIITILTTIMRHI